MDVWRYSDARVCQGSLVQSAVVAPVFQLDLSRLAHNRPRIKRPEILVWGRLWSSLFLSVALLAVQRKN